MRAMLVMQAGAVIGWVALVPAVAETSLDPALLSLSFQANASRLAPTSIVELDRLAVRLHQDDSLRLAVITPLQSDPRRRRLLAAREAELRRHFEARAIHAEFQVDAQARDDDSLTLQLRGRDPPAVAAAPASVMESAAAPPLWRVETGSNLRTLLQDWAGQAGWTVIWRSSYDYPVQASAELRGDFATILPILLGGFSEAKPPPTARIFTANHVAIIE